MYGSARERFLNAYRSARLGFLEHDAIDQRSRDAVEHIARGLLAANVWQRTDADIGRRTELQALMSSEYDFRRAAATGWAIRESLDRFEARDRL